MSQPPPDAWITLPTEVEVRTRLADPMPYDFGFVPAMGRLLIAHETIAPAFGALFAQIMFAPGALDRREREMVAAVAAAAQDCHY
jgi:alkylhydroperoxidase/carboxymuconolactone decarboxylase family protein YurZ